MRSLVVELRGARQAVFSFHEATSLTTKPLELADPTRWLLAWSLGGYMVARRNRTMTQYHFCDNSYQSDREMRDEGNCSNGSGCGNGRDEASGAARAAGGGARQPLGRELRRCRCSGSCVGIHLG